MPRFSKVWVVIIATELYIIGIIGTVIIVLLIVIIFLLQRNTELTMQSDLRSILESPHKKGEMGESVVRMTLQKLPKTIVHEQFTHHLMKGRPDFAIEMTEDMYLIIDAKFTTLEQRQYMVKRGLEIKKYITPGLTFPFVLMWIPDPAWEFMTADEYLQLTSAAVFPVTTASLTPTIHLAEHFYNVIQIAEKYKDAEDYINKIAVLDNKRNDMIQLFTRGIRQMADGEKNLKRILAMLRSFKF